jgi:hypothetical protein
MRCPFVYSKGKQCDGYIDKVTWLDARVEVTLDEHGKATGIDWGSERRMHLECSKKGSHVGGVPHQHTPEIMKTDTLPDEVSKEIDRLCKGK